MIISISNPVVIAIIHFFKFSFTAMCLILRNDVITIYDMANFNIEVFIK